MRRQQFIQRLIAGGMLPILTGPVTTMAAGVNAGISNTALHPGLKLSLNAYSFNDLLIKQSLTPGQLLDFCARQNFEAIDMTGYYFKGYPGIPPDEAIFAFKRHAHALGLSISGTGVRNDFTNVDASLRKADVATVKAWIEVAAKLGAPVLRIFTGLKYPEPAARPAETRLVIDHIGECLETAKANGVILAIQNHFDFIRTADEVIEILNTVNSPWLGLVLDIGSYRGHDPFNDIKKSIPYAVNWQLKEKMYVNGAEVTTDLPRLFTMIKQSGYRGYLPIETLGAGDPFQKVPRFLESVRTAMA
jgi:sugar phosphate isomerase/epimerase